MTGARAGVTTFDVVIPTIGRPSLDRLLGALAAQRLPLPGRVLVVLDRPGTTAPAQPVLDIEAVTGRGIGPAAARNDGWRRSSAPWVAFLDDDVVPGPDWSATLLDDLRAAAPGVAAIQGRLRVPLPGHRRPTDWERNVAGLEGAAWATADMAYRRDALAQLGGFDERFQRAYREDADLALRAVDAGFSLQVGARVVEHPVLPAAWHVSLGKQSGNADDALMDQLHGPGWRERAQAPRGTLRRHVAVTAAGTTALALAATTPLGGHSAGIRRAAAGVAAAAWAVGTASFAWQRIAPGPRSGTEVAAMVATSVAIPPAATWHRLRGERRARRLIRGGGRPDAVLFDRDGTLVHDVPYNGDPAAVVPVPGALAALQRLRRAGIPLGLVTNQSGVARGLLTPEQVEAVNDRVAELLGPFDVTVYCPHDADDGCTCRKPRPGLVRTAAASLGVRPERCAVVGDIGSDVGAALAAGARPILVPTSATRTDEVAAAPEVAVDLTAAVDLLLGAP